MYFNEIDIQGILPIISRSKFSERGENVITSEKPQEICATKLI